MPYVAALASGTSLLREMSFGNADATEENATKSLQYPVL